MTTTIQVSIANLKVDNKYFSFDYVIRQDGKIRKQSIYSSDHSRSDDLELFTTILENGYAFDLALQSVI